MTFCELYYPQKKSVSIHSVQVFLECSIIKEIDEIEMTNSVQTESRLIFCSVVIFIHDITHITY